MAYLNNYTMVFFANFYRTYYRYLTIATRVLPLKLKVVNTLCNFEIKYLKRLRVEGGENMN